MGMQLARGVLHSNGRERTQFSSFRIQTRPPQNLPIRIHHHERLDRRMQRPQIQHQLVERPPVDFAARLHAARRPALPVGVRNRLAGLFRRAGHAPPHAKRDERERVANIQEALEQVGIRR